MSVLADSRLLKRYAAYAPRYDRRWGAYSQATLRHALDAMPIHVEHLLDVACGTGLLARRLRNIHPSVRITGVDPSEPMLEQARAALPEDERTRWLVGHAERLPVESGEFDVVTCTNAFHLVGNGRAALAEFRRVLRPAGTLILVDWCRDFAAMRMLALAHAALGDRTRHVRTLNQMWELLEETGFNITGAHRFTAGWGWGLMCLTATAMPGGARVNLRLEVQTLPSGFSGIAAGQMARHMQ